MSLDVVIADIERHCNNYFNPGNDPNDPTREYPPGFMELAEQIKQFRIENKPSNMTSESVVGFYSKSLDTKSWQQVFAADLSVYKRVRLI